MERCLGNSVNTKALLQTTSTPLKFCLTSFIQVNTYCDDQYLNCEVARVENKKLIKRLFAEQIVLKNALEDGLEVNFNSIDLNCFDIQGQFDHAVCLMRLNNLGPSQFLIQTRFYKANKLIATISQEGCLLAKR